MSDRSRTPSAEYSPRSPRGQSPLPDAGPAPGTPAEPALRADQINIKLAGQRNSAIQFKIKKTTAFIKVMAAYAQREAVDPSSLRFLFEGVRIVGTDTPGSLDMENDDVVEVHAEQVGGGLVASL